jgi:phosphoglycerate dehydrogenase-like enzyme
MSFKLVLMPNDARPGWPEAIRDAVPGVDVSVYERPEDIEDADAAFGTVPPELFPRAKRLRWIQAARAGLGREWFYDDLVNSDVTVTGMHGSYNEHLAGHIMGFVLAFARRFDHYLPYQAQGVWTRDRRPMLDLAEMTAAVIGVGGSGREAGRLCAAFGMRVLGFDVRPRETPEGFDAVYPSDDLDDHIGDADFVLITAPETPETTGMFNAERLAKMKLGAYLINVSRGVVVVTDDLVEALRSGRLAGAGLDVVDPEPLPEGHPLWTMPGVLITPHTAITGANYEERWLELLIENCRRFDASEPLINEVDKQQWF